MFQDINPDVSDLSDADGTSGGRVNALAVAPGTNNQVVYAASEFGGLFKSTDGGSNWTRLDTHLPTRGRDVKVDPSNINKVYATSLYDGRVNSISGIQVSTDGGDTWAHPASATAPNTFNCANNNNQPSAFGISDDPAVPSNVYIGTNCGLAVSTDSGATWTFMDPTQTGAGAMPLNPPMGSPASNVWDVVVHDGSIIDVLTDEGHFRSTTGGTSWSGGVGGLPTSGQPSADAVLAVSPDEAYVLFVISSADQNLWESDDAGQNWTNLGTPDGRRQARGVMIATNQRADDGGGNDIFDIWFGDVGMYRATCMSQTTMGGGARCPMAQTGPAATPPPAGWNGSFTRANGGHDDTADIVFDTTVTVDATPILFSSDGGVHTRNGGNINSPQWQRSNVGLHATWLFSMDGAHRDGLEEEDLYVGLQDDGSWGTRKAGQDPRPDDWHNENCCDIFDIAADSEQVLYDTCCVVLMGGGFSATLQLGGRDRLIGEPGITQPPGGTPVSGTFPDVIDSFGTDKFVVATSTGVYFTSDIDDLGGAGAWTQLDAVNDPAAGGVGGLVQAAVAGGTPTFFVQAGSQLWSFTGTNSAAANWTRLDNNPGNGAGNNINFFAVDPSNPNRLYAAITGGVAPNRILFSTDGGANWSPDPELDNMMTLGGFFSGFNPTLLGLDPGNSNFIVAGGLDSGVFLSTDAGASWRLLSDPIDAGASGVPHLPEPRFAYFDHEEDTDFVLVGTRGRGVWRLDITDLDLDPDKFEPNNTIATSTVLGSLPKITLRDLTIHNATDVDFFQYTAQDTGKLVVNLWDDYNGILDVRVRDRAGNIISTGAQNDAPGINRQTLVIPVVTQEQYFIEVYSSVGHTNNYDLEIENFAAPVPIAIDLAAADDTGRSDSDNVTSDRFGQISIVSDLFDFAEEGIEILTPADVTAGLPGAAVEVFVDGDSKGFATVVGGSENTLFSFTFEAGDLAEGLNFVTAAVHIFDGKMPQADGRSQLSEPLLLTLDVTAPDTPSAPNLLAASDSGTFDDDNVTNKMEPAFDGATERNALVRVRADGVVVGEGLSSSSGHWEITVEPLRDNVHAMTVVVEDLAGNVSNASAALDVEIDTLAPNTAHLDLVEASDTGRHNDDNITMDNTPDMSATTEDPPATGAADHMSATNLKFRIFDRLEESAETLVYFSTLTSATQVTPTLPALADGIHNLKLEVEDRAGNISHDFLLDVLIDTEAPGGTVNLHPDSDTGLWGIPETMMDGITADKVPLLYGATEANALVRIGLDIDENPPDGLPDGTSVALPYDGDDAFPPPPEFDGNYFLQTILMLADGEHTLTAFFQDVAGNETDADDAPELTIFIDTQGPKITNVTRGLVSTDNIFSFDGVTSLFQPKPSENGPDPLVHSIVVHFSDLPDRTDMFDDYDALLEALAAEEGNYQLVGDHNGNIAIVEVNVTFMTVANDGLPETAEVELVFDAPLPDDRFTLLVDDSITDAAGNLLDGESGAQGPFEGNDVPDETPPIFPTGDGAHGGDFAGRFTIDSRPEIGTYAQGTVYVDINGNFVFDPEGKDRDYTNRDIVFPYSLRDDRIFAGNFAEEDAVSASGFDKLGAYGILDGLGGKAWRWRLDFNHDGVVDYEVISGKQVAANPVAGDFTAAHPGDEVGLFDGVTWYLDTNGNNNIDDGDTQLRGNMRGLPIVGDFDGDGLDDLGTWRAGNEGQHTKGAFLFDLAANGLTGDFDVSIDFDFSGVREFPVAADMNADGIDDVGLFVERRQGVFPEEAGEWFFLISDDPTATPGEVTALNHPYTPVPFGTDIFAQFGDEAATPIVGNFDPPSGPLPQMQPAGQSVAAVFRDGFWFFDTADDGAAAEKAVPFGLPGDVPLLGDWNGDGTDEPAVFRDGIWFFDSGDGGPAERAFAFGLPGDVPIVADWDGDGVDEAAVFRDGLWFFDLDGAGGRAEYALQFGLPGDVPVAGDWDGGGADDLGLYRDGLWFMDMNARGGVGERFVQFGLPGDRPVVGDWNGDGFDNVAIDRDGLWYFDMDGRGGAGERFVQFGLPGDVPLAYHFLPSQPVQQPSQGPGAGDTMPPPDQGTGDGMLSSFSAVDGSSGDGSSGLPSSAPASGDAASPLRGTDPDSERNDPDLVDGVFGEYDDLQDLFGELAGALGSGG